MLKSKYWDKVSTCMRRRPYYIPSKLGEYKKREFVRILDKWADKSGGLALKTDSFEEAFGSDSPLDVLRQKYQKVIGLDISREIAVLAKQKNTKNGLSWTVCDIAKMPFKDREFSIILSTSTFGYLINIEEGISEAYRILKPGGLLILSVNNFYNIFFRIVSKTGAFLNKLPFPISRSYRPAQLKKILKQAGFAVEAYEPAVQIFPLLNSLSTFLAARDNRFYNGVSAIIEKFLDRYSRGAFPVKYFTGWFIVFKARKKA